MFASNNLNMSSCENFFSLTGESWLLVKELKDSNESLKAENARQSTQITDYERQLLDLQFSCATMQTDFLNIVSTQNTIVSEKAKLELENSSLSKTKDRIHKECQDIKRKYTSVCESVDAISQHLRDINTVKNVGPSHPKKRKDTLDSRNIFEALSITNN